MTIARSQRSAFTLLEMLLVLLIIGLLSTAVAYNFLSRGEQARIDTTKAKLQVLRTAMTDYNFSNGRYPTTQDTLRVLMPRYIEHERALRDAWDTPFSYYSPTTDPNRPFDIVSAGPDRQEGTDDDISIWDD